MSPVLRALLYLALTFFAIFLAIKPYNWFCQISEKCHELVLANLIPEAEGNHQIKVLMEARDEREDIDFEVVEPKMFNTVSGRKNETTYRIKNITKHSVKFRPEFSVEPKEFTKYINRQECLCFREYKIEEGEQIIVPASFYIKGKINAEDANKENLTIRIIYTAKKS